MASRYTQRCKVQSLFVRRRRETRPIIQGIVSLARRTLNGGGEVTMSSPSSSSVWQHPDIAARMQAFSLHTATVSTKRRDGKIMQMRYLCSSRRQIEGVASLGAEVLEHPREEEVHDYTIGC